MYVYTHILNKDSTILKFDVKLVLFYEFICFNI